MSCLRLYRAFALLLFGACGAVFTAHAQPPNPSTNDSNGTRPLPPIPGEKQDLPAKYDKDPTIGAALLAEERLNSQLRQKQLTEAIELLQQVVRELRAELAASPDGTRSETENLKLIEKLAHLIQDREKAEDQVTAALARTGRTP
jgi:hypothetical protein